LTFTCSVAFARYRGEARYRRPPCAHAAARFGAPLGSLRDANTEQAV